MTAGAVAVGAAGLATVALVLVSLRPVPDAAGHRRVVTTLRAGYEGRRTSSSHGVLAPREASNDATVAELSSGLDSPSGLAFDAKGDLWVANESANTVVGYTPSQLLLGLPGTSLSSGRSESLGSPCALVFDSAGDLWVANESADTIVEYAPSQLVGGAPVPRVTVSSSSSGLADSLDGPSGLAFDAKGDLWVANETANTVIEYTPGQLVTGSPEPHATISPHAASAGLSASLSGPRDLVFGASGALWVADEEGDDLVEYAPDQLVSGSPAPRATISSGPSNGLSVPLGLAFDASGDLWVTNEEADDLVEYTPDQLESGSPSPRVTVSGSSGGFDWPLGDAFDSSGDLWVANYSTNSLVEFAPRQLTTGSPAPTAVISSDTSGTSGTSDSLDGPDGLAFDASGDLWVANYDEVTGANSLVEFAPSQLTTGSPAPTAVISSDTSGSLDEPEGLAFDSSGDLWVANYSGNSLVEFAPRQLATGSPAPTAVISSDTSGSLDEPEGLAFDSSGDLWVANYNSSTLVEYTPDELATGAPTPAITISPDRSGSLDAPDDLAFDPSGDLWVANYNSNTVVEYSPGGFTSGPEVPDATISSGSSNSLDGPDGLAFQRSGDLWVVNFNNNTAVEYAPSS
ncbi:MAG: NHL repeat-containing protein [Acidimicrobiales bacterium]